MAALVLCPCISALVSPPQFIVIGATDNFGYVSLQACQAALMLAAGRYVIVLSPQTSICMKRVTSGFFIALDKQPEADMAETDPAISAIVSSQSIFFEADKLFESEIYLCVYEVCFCVCVCVCVCVSVSVCVCVCVCVRTQNYDPVLKSAYCVKT